MGSWNILVRSSRLSLLVCSLPLRCRDCVDHCKLVSQGMRAVCVREPTIHLAGRQSGTGLDQMTRPRVMRRALHGVGAWLLAFVRMSLRIDNPTTPTQAR